MAYRLSDTINLGVGIETTRGTVIAPAAWLRGRSPTGIQQVIERKELPETSLTGLDTEENIIVKREVVGDCEFNVRRNSFGYFLMSLFSRYVQTNIMEGAAIVGRRHTFSPASSPLHRSLTLAVAQPSPAENYDYPLAIARSLIFRTPVDDVVNATVGFNATREIIRPTAHTVAFDTADTIFRHDQATIRIAPNVAGLATAPILNLENIEINISAIALSKQYVGTLDVSEILSGNMTAEITLTIDAGLTTEFRSMYRTNLLRVLELSVVDTTRNIGTVTMVVHPTIRFLFHQVQVLSFTEARALNEVVKEEVVLKAYNNPLTASSIDVELINNIATY